MNRYFVTVRRNGSKANELTLAVTASDVFDAREKAVKSAGRHSTANVDAVRVVAA